MRKRNSVPDYQKLAVKIASNYEKNLLWENRKKFEISIEKSRLFAENTPIFKTFVALFNGEIAGFCQAARIPGNVVEIKRFAVRKGLQKGGIGRALRKKVEGYYIRNGVKRFVLSSRPAARTFYEKAGYVAKNVGRLSIDFEKHLERKPRKQRPIRGI